MSQHVQLILKMFSKKRFVHIMYHFIYTYTWRDREREGGEKGAGSGAGREGNVVKFCV